jgi:transcriptional regulator with XRE-family HTH domain
MLQELRKKAGLTQAELASRSGLPLRSVQNWERSHRVPRAAAILALSEALGAPVEELMRGVAASPRRKGKKGK